MNPLHLDEEFAKQKVWETCCSRCSTQWPNVSVLGIKLPAEDRVLLSQDIRFPAPLHAGEEVVARVQITSLKKFLAFIRVSCVATQSGQTVMEGTVKVLVPGD
ncbi:unnamed protein product [Staurois parvus]|uniref:MaoC-like domain-containing protein n=1 Tax=Staurois parvus TaxID=386267 RepID=A0ABN9G003_9NEOB|nr:unnamed protein product [Staurois parvus]